MLSGNGAVAERSYPRLVREIMDSGGKGMPRRIRMAAAADRDQHFASLKKAGPNAVRQDRD